MLQTWLHLTFKISAWDGQHKQKIYCKMYKVNVNHTRHTSPFTAQPQYGKYQQRWRFLIWSMIFCPGWCTWLHQLSVSHALELQCCFQLCLLWVAGSLWSQQAVAVRYGQGCRLQQKRHTRYLVMMCDKTHLAYNPIYSCMNAASLVYCKWYACRSNSSCHWNKNLSCLEMLLLSTWIRRKVEVAKWHVYLSEWSW